MLGEFPYPFLSGRHVSPTTENAAIPRAPLFSWLPVVFGLSVLLGGCPAGPEGDPDCTVNHCMVPDRSVWLWGCDEEGSNLYAERPEVTPSPQSNVESLSCDTDLVDYLGSTLSEGHATGDGCIDLGLPSDRVGTYDEVCSN